jgi:anhydro-N-acetylmuramic acid kinase
VYPTSDHGIDPDWVEAILFAWLAHQRLENRPLPTPAITGAEHAVTLGRLCDRHGTRTSP